MASNNSPAERTTTHIVEVSDEVAEFIAKLPNPTPSEAEVLAFHRAKKGAAATAGPGGVDAGGPRPGAWPSSAAGNVASRLASSGFTDLGSDTRWSTLEPGVRERLERTMLDSQDQWRRPGNPFHVRHQQENEHPRSFHRLLHHHEQQQQQQQHVAQHARFAPPPPFPIRPRGPHQQEQTPASLRAPQGGQANGAVDPAQERVRELLASQREHLLAAVEIDHQLREIWLQMQASGGQDGAA